VREKTRGNEPGSVVRDAGRERSLVSSKGAGKAFVEDLAEALPRRVPAVSAQPPELSRPRTPVAVGYDTATDRELFLLELDRLEELTSPLALPARHFACLLVLDGRRVGAGDLHRCAATLLAKGAVHLSVWGPGCGQIRSLLDDAVLFSETEATEASIVFTEDHEGEPLEDALVHLLERSQPAARYVESCRAALVVAVNAPGWALACREALCDPRAFVAGLAWVES
jgi:hypothetical protein